MTVKHVVVAAGAIALAAAFAPTAFAEAPRESEEQIETDCTNEVEGDYSTSVNSQTGVRTSKCCYQGLTGMSHCDVFYDGVWSTDDSYRDDPPAPGDTVPETIVTPVAPVDEAAPPVRSPQRPGVFTPVAPRPVLAP